MCALVKNFNHKNQNINIFHFLSPEYFRTQLFHERNIKPADLVGFLTFMPGAIVQINGKFYQNRLHCPDFDKYV
jgi:hypothetical protein